MPLTAEGLKKLLRTDICQNAGTHVTRMLYQLEELVELVRQEERQACAVVASEAAIDAGDSQAAVTAILARGRD